MTDYDLQDLAGRALIIGFEGLELGSDLTNLLREIQPGGIILFRRNVGGGPRQVARLIQDCQDLAQSEFGRALLVAIDQEGGPVRRLEAPFSVLPSQRTQALTLTPEEVRALAERGARELAAVGVNLNLTPVLDLADEGTESYIFERSFGPLPSRNSVFVQAVIQGHASAGVLTCGKHFPGIGATHLDPHKDLPVVRLSAERIRSREVLPFVEALAAGLPTVMTAHVLYPDLDPDYPATFSEIILGGLLRGELGFSGPVISDDLEMGGALKFGPFGPAAVRSIQAGCDLLLICHRPDRIREAHQALIEAADTQEGLEDRLLESADRVDALWDGTAEAEDLDLEEVFFIDA